MHGYTERIRIRYLGDMAATTTIKLSPSTRDRINARARERGMTPGALVEALLDADDRERRFETVRLAYSQLAADDHASEAAEWDATNLDGLDNA